MNNDNVPLVEEDGHSMHHLSCVGCGTKERVKPLLFKTIYEQDTRADRQVIPMCEMCSLDMGMALYHIWNAGSLQ